MAVHRLGRQGWRDCSLSVLHQHVLMSHKEFPCPGLRHCHDDTHQLTLIAPYLSSVRPNKPPSACHRREVLREAGLRGDNCKRCITSLRTGGARTHPAQTTGPAAHAIKRHGITCGNVPLDAAVRTMAAAARAFHMGGARPTSRVAAQGPRGERKQMRPTKTMCVEGS